MRVFVFVLIILIVVAYVAMSAVLISKRIDSHKLGEYKNTLEEENDEIKKLEGGVIACAPCEREDGKSVGFEKVWKEGRE